MRNFVLGAVVTVVGMAVVVAGYAGLGIMPTNAGATPPMWEARIAAAARDASVSKHAPRVSDPLAPTDANIIEGIKIYSMNCTGCHGALDKKQVEFGQSFYPPAPQLILDPPDDPEWHIYYVVRNVVRYTAMPAWGKTMSESDMWKVTAFLARVEKLSPAVQEYWRKNFGGETPKSGQGGESDGNDHS